MVQVVRVGSPASLETLSMAIGEEREPGVGEVRVELHASSLNFHDYLVVAGALATEPGRVPMSDGAGVVVQLGEGVTALAIGDHVVSTFYPDWVAGRPTAQALATLPGDRTDGFARTSVVAPARAFTKAPQGWTHEDAATLPCAALTAWRALFVEATVNPGDIVLVEGTGGVSVFALQLAKAAGATVVATTSSDEKMVRLEGLGADHVVNYRSEPAWGKAVRRWTGGRGVDHVVEIGGDFEQAAAACTQGGHIALVSMLDGTARPFPFVPMIGKNLRISGLSVGSREHQLDMVRALEANGLRPVIDNSFGLPEIADAFRYQESRRHVGKIVLSW